MVNEEERLRNRIALELCDRVMYYSPQTIEDLLRFLVPAILDEFDDVFEKAWAYDQLCD